MGAEPLRTIEGGAAPRDWERLWARYVWFQSELPHGDLPSSYRGEETLRFEWIGQPWLKEAAKRWARGRLLADTAPRTMSGYLVSVRHFSQWLAEDGREVARAKQALPNGYCGLPLVQSCPHPNACLGCESFLTDGSFHAVHEQHQGETRRLLEKASRQGNLRLIEVLERDEQSLTRILEGIDQIEADHEDELDLRDLAASGEAGNA
jgi:hypothetical protein